MTGSKIVHLFCVDREFGGCPSCGKYSGYVNAGRTHVFYCDAHNVSWIAGANLFSDWRNEIEQEQRVKYRHIEGYRRVEPIGLDYYQIKFDGDEI